jgi:hypothetical protein
VPRFESVDKVVHPQNEHSSPSHEKGSEQLAQERTNLGHRSPSIGVIQSRTHGHAAVVNGEYEAPATGDDRPV